MIIGKINPKCWHGSWEYPIEPEGIDWLIGGPNSFYSAQKRLLAFFLNMHSERECFVEFGIEFFPASRIGCASSGCASAWAFSTGSQILCGRVRRALLFVAAQPVHPTPVQCAPWAGTLWSRIEEVSRPAPGLLHERHKLAMLNQDIK